MKALDGYLSRLEEKGPGPFPKRGQFHLFRDGMERFQESGFPKTDSEQWRFTDVSPIERTAYKAGKPRTLTKDEAASVDAVTGTYQRIVLVNGALDKAMTRLSGLGAGACVRGLAEAFSESPDEIGLRLSRARGPQSPFTDLNSAMWTDGAVVDVSASLGGEVTLHIVHVAVGNGGATDVHPRALIHAGRGARLVLVETFLSLSKSNMFVNAVTTIEAEEESRVDYVKVEYEGDAAFHVAGVRAVTRDGGILRTHVAGFTGALVRNDLEILLDGENAEGSAHGFCLLQGSRHMDNHVTMEHAKPRSASDELYKTVLCDASRAVFDGTIVVAPGAQKTDARQMNRALLLSDKARINSMPRLKINADDVRCMHGATVGALDEEAVFYLRSRGIGDNKARALLTQAFAAEVLDRIPVADLRSALYADFSRRLLGEFRREQ